MDTVTTVVIIIIVVVVIIILGMNGPNSSQMGGKKKFDFKRIFLFLLGILFLYFIVKKIDNLNLGNKTNYENNEQIQ